MRGFFVPEGPLKRQGVSDFVRAAQYQVMAKEYPGEAFRIATASGASSNVLEVLKAAVAPGTDLNPDYSALAGVQAITAQFAEEIATVSLFYEMYGGGMMNRSPFNSRTIWSAADARAFIVGEGAAIPLTGLDFEKLSGLPRLTAAAIVIVSDELAKSAGTAGTDQINRLLLNALGATIDAEMFAQIIDPDTPEIVSAGADADDAILDLRSLLEAVAPNVSSRLMLAMNPGAQRRAAFLTTMAGGFLFPELTVDGGSIKGIPCRPTNGLAAGEVALVDGNRLVSNSETFAVTGSTQTSVEMSDAPTQSGATSTGSTMISLWQSNLAGFLARAWFGVARTKDDAVAKLTGVAWGGAVNES